VSERNSIGVKLAKFLDLPLDTALDWPKLVMSANRSLIVQNHRGVIEYDRKLIRINTKFGELAISGENLNLIAAFKDEIAVEGRICRVELLDWR